MAARARDWRLVPRLSPCLGPSLSRIREGGFRPPLDDLQTPVSGSNPATRGPTRHCSGLCAEATNSALGFHPRPYPRRHGYSAQCIQNTEYTKQTAATFIMILALKGQGSGKMQAQSCHPSNGGGRYTDRGRAQRALRRVKFPPAHIPCRGISGREGPLFRPPGKRVPFSTSLWRRDLPFPPDGCMRARKDRFASDATRSRAQACARPATGRIGLLLGEGKEGGWVKGWGEGGGGVWWWPGGQLSRPESDAILPVRLPLLRHPERRHIISPEFVCVFLSLSTFLGTLLSGDSAMVCVWVSDEGP